MRFGTLCCLFFIIIIFFLIQAGRSLFHSVEVKPDFGVRSECMNAENLCTTYYLVLLLTMLTPALRCGVYLLPVCAEHSVLFIVVALSVFVPLRLIMMKWLWMSCPFLSFLILIGQTYSQPWIIGRPLIRFHLLLFFFFFLHFDTIFDYIYCPSYSELVKAF